MAPCTRARGRRTRERAAAPCAPPSRPPAAPSNVRPTEAAAIGVSILLSRATGVPCGGVVSWPASGAPPGTGTTGGFRAPTPAMPAPRRPAPRRARLLFARSRLVWSAPRPVRRGFKRARGGVWHPSPPPFPLPPRPPPPGPRRRTRSRRPPRHAGRRSKTRGARRREPRDVRPKPIISRAFGRAESSVSGARAGGGRSRSGAYSLLVELLHTAKLKLVSRAVCVLCACLAGGGRSKRTW